MEIPRVPWSASDIALKSGVKHFGTFVGEMRAEAAKIAEAQTDEEAVVALESLLKTFEAWRLSTAHVTDRDIRNELGNPDSTENS